METKKTLKNWQKLGFVMIAGLVFVDIGLFFNIRSLPYWWSIGAMSGIMLQAMMGNDKQ